MFAEFYAFLSETDQDTFTSCLNDLIQSGSQKVRQRFGNTLREVKEELDKVNAKREVLTSQATVCERMIEKLSDFSAHSSAVEISMLQSIFRYRHRELKCQIAQTRPNDLLKKKADLMQTIKILESISESAKDILTQLSLEVADASS